MPHRTPKRREVGLRYNNRNKCRDPPPHPTTHTRANTHTTQQQHPQLSSPAVAARIKLPEPNCKHRFTTSFLQLREDGCRKARLGAWTRPKGRAGRAADLPAGRDRSGACCTIHCLWGGAVVETATHTHTKKRKTINLAFLGDNR